MKKAILSLIFAMCVYFIVMPIVTNQIQNMAKVAQGK